MPPALPENVSEIRLKSETAPHNSIVHIYYTMKTPMFGLSMHLNINFNGLNTWVA